MATIIINGKEFTVPSKVKYHIEHLLLQIKVSEELRIEMENSHHEFNSAVNELMNSRLKQIQVLSPQLVNIKDIL